MFEKSSELVLEFHNLVELDIFRKKRHDNLNKSTICLTWKKTVKGCPKNMAYEYKYKADHMTNSDVFWLLSFLFIQSAKWREIWQEYVAGLRNHLIQLFEDSSQSGILPWISRQLYQGTMHKRTIKCNFDDPTKSKSSDARIQLQLEPCVFVILCTACEFFNDNYENTIKKFLSKFK